MVLKKTNVVLHLKINQEPKKHTNAAGWTACALSSISSVGLTKTFILVLTSTIQCQKAWFFYAMPRKTTAPTQGA